MAKNCPVCNFLNPYGAQVCGECGHELIAAESLPRPGRGIDKGVPQSSSPITPSGPLKSIGLIRINNEKRPFNVLALTLTLFSYGLILIMLSLVLWFKPGYGLDFIILPEYLYPLMLGFFLGIFTITLAYSIYLQKGWMSIGYFVWVFVQVIIFIVLRSLWWRPAWFGMNTQMVFGVILILEILLIFIILKIKGRFFSS